MLGVRSVVLTLSHDHVLGHGRQCWSYQVSSQPNVQDGKVLTAVHVAPETMSTEA
jgi:hypothetical protein